MPKQKNLLQKQLQQLVNGETTIEKVFPYPELLTNPDNIFSYSNLKSPFFIHRSDIDTELPEQLSLSISQSENEKQETLASILSFEDTDLLVKTTQNWFADKENYKRLKGGDVLPVLKDGASFCKRFTSETENVFRGIDITVV